MSDSSRQGMPGLPRLSHADAEALISARSDAPLPQEQNRVLLAHLATCPSCRAFADQVQAMSQALRDLPMLPASPTVSRQVRERISVQPSPWVRLAGWMFSGPWGVMPAAATALLLVAVATVFTVLQGGGPTTGNQVTGVSQTETAIVETGTATTAPTRIATQPAALVDTPRVSTREPEQPGFVNIQVTLTPTSEPSATATPTTEPTATATDQPRTPATIEPTGTATSEPSATATSAPTQTPDPTATKTRPADTPTTEPTATRTPTVAPTETSAPSETPTAEPTATPEPTETPAPSETPTATAEPTETDTPEPTVTNTQEPTATDTPRPTRTPTPTPTETPIPEPTETPTEAPFVQPTIGARGGSGAADTGEYDPIQEATEEPGLDTGPAETAPASETPDDIRIVQVAQGTETPDDQVAPTEDATEASTPDDDVVPGGPLADAELLGELGPGVTGPASGLAVPVDGSLQVVLDGAGALAVVDANGSVTAGLGAAAHPLWSPQGQVLLYADLNNGDPVVAMWDRTDGQYYRAGTESEVAVADHPAGWIGAELYYVREYRDGSGRLELHRAAWNGDDDVLLWSGDGIALAGERPVATLDGVLIPTADSWLFVDTAGNESDRGANTTGAVDAAELSPFGSLIAYPSGGQLVIAPVANPGSPQATVPYDGVSGFDFAPNGEQIVVASGGSLAIYSTLDGSVVASAAADDGTALAAPYWGEDGIRYLEIAGTTRLKLIHPESFS